MKKAYVFPGQGSQFPGMAKTLYETNETARAMLDRANEILGFRITDIMFEGTAEELKQTKVTQPAIFLHSVVLAKWLPDFDPDMVRWAYEESTKDPQLSTTYVETLAPKL